MTKETIQKRIQELINIQTQDTLKRGELLAQQELKQQELNEIQNEISKTLWENKPESLELKELLIVQKYMEV